MKIRFATFNLYQYLQAPFSWYVKKDKFTPQQWEQKQEWIKTQIEKMNCDIIGFQEVFSHKELKKLLSSLGFKYFKTVDSAKKKKENPNVYTSTVVAIASKYPIKELQRVEVDVPSLKRFKYKGFFKFSRIPLKAKIDIEGKEILVYIAHFKSNRLNEFEYIFTKNDTLEYKKEKVQKALEEKFSNSLRQRLCEASSIYEDMQKEQETPKVLMCDLNDKEFSLTIDALTNGKFYDEKKEELLFDAYYIFDKEIYNPHPEQKEIPRTPTSYFTGKGNILDYIFVSSHFNKNIEGNIAEISSYEVLDEHLKENPNGSILKSDHAQVICEILLS